ncbi:MAG: hypothetical protein IBX55_00165 [Methyloprofundus sp.]|nr:hypothetical protein [Methyloprofundus sp.]
MLKSLKNQLAFFSVGAVLVTAGIFYVVDTLQQAKSDQAIYEERAIAQSSLIGRMSFNSTLRLQENLTQATRNETLLSAIVLKDIETIRKHIFTYENRLTASNIVSEIRVTDKEGRILYSRDKSEIGQLIGLGIVSEAASETLIKSGYETYKGKLENHLSFPLTERGRVIGVLHFSLDSEMMFYRLDKLTNSDHWVIVDNKGETIASANGSLKGLIEKIDLDHRDLGMETFKIDGRIYSSVSSSLKDYKGQGFSTLTTFTDITDSFNSDRLVEWMTWSAIVIWLLIVAVAIFFFLGRKLRPLNDMKEIAGYIKNNGDLTKRITVIGNNEIAQSANAINDILSIVDSLVRDSNNLLSEIGKGNFEINHLKLDPAKYQGDMKSFSTGLNDSVESVRFTMSELESIAKELNEGRFDAKMSNEVQGTIRQTMDGLASSLSSIVGEVNLVMKGVQVSDFSRKVDVEAKGDLGLLVSSINSSIENLSTGFNDIVNASKRMAKGDFTKGIDADYQYSMGEAKNSINQSMTDLSYTMRQVIESTSDIKRAINDVASGTDSLNDRTQQQAASLEETSSAMEETSAQVQANVDSTSQALSIAQSETKILQEANRSMSLTQEAMKGIKDTSSQIQEITSLIDSISFQTNLLALNAAVEAARAGDHGRGFAVVAGEVRALAGKSAEAAKEIGGLIEKAVEAVDEGVLKVDEVNGYLESVTSETYKLSEIIESITSASEQQSQGINEINTSVSNIDGITQQNAALVEQTHASVEQMQQISNELSDLMIKFKLKEI